MNEDECGKPDNLKRMACEVNARVLELEKRLRQVSNQLIADPSPIANALTASHANISNLSGTFTTYVGPVDADDLATPLRKTASALREVEQLMQRIELKLGL